jgi:glucose-6-phosphate 1-dehydrogenase
MVQNHLVQMLAYLCMEPPATLAPAAVRAAKSRLLESVRLLRREDVERDCVRGQYGEGLGPDGARTAGYRHEPKVDPRSNTETYAAIKLHIDNERWAGIPVYLRSGKALWKRGTEIVVQFRTAPGEAVDAAPAAGAIEPNLLIFHIQPVQGVEIRLQAKRPGPAFALQRAGMRFDYAETFEAARGTGYEVLLYSAMNDDPTPFSRTDFVENAWRIVQPILDRWTVAAGDYPNYGAGTWGPRAASALLERDGRRWHEIPTREVLARSEFFGKAPAILLDNLMLAMHPVAVAAGQVVVTRGECRREMYFVCRGELEALGAQGERIGLVREGEFFGEMALLFDRPRSATVRATRPCDLFVLDGTDFGRVLSDFPQADAEFRRIAAARAAPADVRRPC